LALKSQNRPEKRFVKNLINSKSYKIKGKLRFPTHQRNQVIWRETSPRMCWFVHKGAASSHVNKEWFISQRIYLWLRK